MTKPDRTLLDCITAARSSCTCRGGNRGSSHADRQYCLTVAASHRGRLAARIVSEGRYAYCQAGGNPWPILASWVRETFDPYGKIPIA